MSRWLIGDYLNAMHSACIAFTNTESSKKLKRDIKGKTRNGARCIYQPGDIVYFRRENSNFWKDPETVLRA